MKKAIKILSVVCALLIGLSAKADWTLSEDGVLTITSDYDYSSSSGYPWYASRGNVKSVVITEGVTKIGKYAFNGYSGLTSVTIPESVTSIGNSAFCLCSSIKELHINSLDSWCRINLGSTVFMGSSKDVKLYVGEEEVTELVIPEDVTSIGNYTFYGCMYLTSVTIPEGITRIADYAFSGCSGIKELHIGSIESWCRINLGKYVFDSFSDVKLYAGNEEVTEVEIPQDVTSINNYAFCGCKYLTSVTIPESVTSIGNDAFSGCSGLTKVTIPSTVTVINDYAFKNCSSLTSVIIPENVTSIGNFAFAYSGLTSITIPKKVTTIGIGAFASCSGLTSVTIPSSVTSIGEFAFSSCSGLTSLSFLGDISKIGNNFMSFDYNLKYVFLHQNSVVDNLTEIFPTYKTIERFFVPDNILSNYREKYGTDENLKDKFTGFSMITKQEAAGGEEETVALSLEKGSYNFITWAVNSGEQVRNGEEISIALTEDFDLVADDVTWQTLGTAEHPFKGIFEGNGHSIIFGGDAANSDNTLFGHIDEGAEIRNLNVENMNVMSGDDNKVVDGEYTYYPILAKENRGTIKKCVVSGSVMCDEEIENDEKSIGCFIVDNYGTLDHVVEFYKYGIEAEGNKRNIVIMQNMGVGRYAGQTRKVCNNRKKKKKSLSATPSSDVNDDYREYTDEEMASGEPAYWLNYAGKGYTGDYTSEWSKGKMHPIMATELSKPAVKVVYEIEGASESYAGLKDPVFFANEDDEIEIETAVAPEKVWLGNNVAEELNSKTKLTKKLLSSAAKDGIITVHLMYSKATGIENAKAEKSIRVNGHAISIEGAEGESYSIVDVMGRTVAEGEANGEKTIVVPAAGIYVVKAGDRAQKIVVK